MRKRKSRAHMQISGNSPKCTRSSGLDGGAEGYRTIAKIPVTTVDILASRMRYPEIYPQLWALDLAKHALGNLSSTTAAAGMPDVA